MFKKIIYKKFIQPKDSYFRAGAGIVITDDKDQVLMFERADKPGEFQFPQGGLDTGEEPALGVMRELFEETALQESDLKDVYELPGWFTYSYPSNLAVGETYRGQTQKWYTAHIKPGTTIDLASAHDKEFVSHKWVARDEVVKEVVDFKKDMYGRIMNHIQ